MPDKRYHIAIHLSKEEKWKFKEVAAKKQKSAAELIKDWILELIKEER